ncbi:MAG TPA: peptidylprolyl isomerase [bacterium]
MRELVLRIAALACVALLSGCGGSDTDSPGAAPEEPRPAAARAAEPEFAGRIFGVPVSVGNYSFAKRVALMYSPPFGMAHAAPERQEEHIWRQLVLHYEAFRRGIEATDEELNELAGQFLSANGQTFTREGDPDAYARWTEESLGLDPEHLDNQLAYLIAIRALKHQVLEGIEVEVTEEEMRREFLNEQRHVGGAMVTFETREEAEAFVRRAGTSESWDVMAAAGGVEVRPVSLMTLEAYIDLWGVSQEQMDALHALETGGVGPPMPFGTQWCVFRVLEKRDEDPEEFPARRDDLLRQLEHRKRAAALEAWINDLEAQAAVEIFLDHQPRSNSEFGIWNSE